MLDVKFYQSCHCNYRFLYLFFILNLFPEEHRVEHNHRGMGRKGNWFKTLKKALSPSSKRKKEQVNDFPTCLSCSLEWKFSSYFEFSNILANFVMVFWHVEDQIIWETKTLQFRSYSYSDYWKPDKSARKSKTNLWGEWRPLQSSSCSNFKFHRDGF